MKRWAFVTVLLYALALLLLTAPVLLLVLGKWWGNPKTGFALGVADTLQVFQTGGYWLWLGVMVLGQILLLVVPVDLSQRRLVPQRKLLVPVLTAAFLFANIVFAGIMALACAIGGDKPFNVFGIFGQSVAGNWAALILIVALLWTIWGVAFYRMTRADAPPTAGARLTRWLLRGSILELLVAVPSHVIIRHRDVCCAPAASFWGITTGLSVMLLCYGPGVFLLFAERISRKRTAMDKS